jgi:hypothetical protein
MAETRFVTETLYRDRLGETSLRVDTLNMQPGSMRTLLVLLVGAATLFSPGAGASAQETDGASAGPQALQTGFGLVDLGMSMDQVKSALADDPNFDYRGDPDVSFLPYTEVPIIETAGTAFVSTGIFQFHDDSLYVITLVLNDRRLDYFTLYDSLRAKYGEPNSLTPSTAIWESEVVRIALEKPLTVKYIDVPVFDALVREGEMNEAIETVTRDRFLEQL